MTWSDDANTATLAARRATRSAARDRRFQTPEIHEAARDAHQRAAKLHASEGRQRVASKHEAQADLHQLKANAIRKYRT